MKRVMLDIETLATDPNAVVTSVGLAVFDKTDLVEEAGFYLNYKSDTGVIEPRTLRWWLTQAPETLTINLLGDMPLQDAATQITKMFHQVDEVWANAPTFDCTILRNWFLRLGHTHAPWHWRNERCCRTMFAIGRQLGVKYPGNEAKHDAMADAVAQAKYLLAIEQALKL